MIQRVKNEVKITSNHADFLNATAIEVWVGSGGTTKTYTPTVVDEHTLLFEIPKADAMLYTRTVADVQFGYTDVEGNPKISKIVSVPISALIKEAGYGN